jgi:HCOMODA/2-hydroxy-3-carboxy-muconic semialdehyde decarboxylase
MAGLLGTSVPLWDAQDEFGDTDMLVRTMEQGASLARTLGARRVALMRGHGSVVAGEALREVVIAAVYMEVNARLQIQALGMGDVRYLTDGEIERTADWWSSPLAVERAWNTWVARTGLADAGS